MNSLFVAAFGVLHSLATCGPPLGVCVFKAYMYGLENGSRGEHCSSIIANRDQTS